MLIHKKTASKEEMIMYCEWDEMSIVIYLYIFILFCFAFLFVVYLKTLSVAQTL